MFKNILLLSLLVLGGSAFAQQIAVTGVTGATSFSMDRSGILGVTAVVPQDSDALVFNVQVPAGSTANVYFAADYGGHFVNVQMNRAPNSQSVSIPWVALCSLMKNSNDTCSGLNSSLSGVIYQDTTGAEVFTNTSTQPATGVLIEVSPN